MDHTPGPWKAQRIFQNIHGIIKSEAWEVRTEGYDVATYIPFSAPIRKEADARLIAAAPDLLAALQVVQTLLYTRDAVRRLEIADLLERIDRVIEKAS